MRPVTKFTLKCVVGLAAVACIGVVVAAVQATAPFTNPIIFMIIISSFVSLVILTPVTVLVAYGMRRIFKKSNKSAAWWSFFIVMIAVRVLFGGTGASAATGAPLLQAFFAYWFLQRIDAIRASAPADSEKLAMAPADP